MVYNVCCGMGYLSVVWSICLQMAYMHCGEQANWQLVACDSDPLHLSRALDVLSDQVPIIQALGEPGMCVKALLKASFTNS